MVYTKPFNIPHILPSRTRTRTWNINALVAQQKKRDFVIIPGIGRVLEPVVEQLADLIALTREEVWLALKREGPNSIRVTYALLRDEHRQHMQRECCFCVHFFPLWLITSPVLDYADEEQDLQTAQIAGLNPNIHLAEPEAGAISPPVVLPGPTGVSELNPFEELPTDGEEEGSFDDDDDDDEDDEDDSDVDDDIATEMPESNSFAVLHTSLPGHMDSPAGARENIRPLLGATPSGERERSGSTSKRERGGSTSGLAGVPGTPPVKEKKSKMRWHFGIRSRSPPMEVMLEIYETLSALGFEWREKKGVWGVRGKKPEHSHDLNDSIYLVETRCRVRDIVVSTSFFSCPPSCS